MSLFDVYPKLLDAEWLNNYDLDNCFSQGPDNPYHDLDVAVALLRYNANYSMVANALGRSRRSVVNFVMRKEELAELAEDIEEALLDIVDFKLRSAAEAGDMGICKFLATTKGKSRGYTVRTETTGKDGEPIDTRIKVDLSKMSEEELLAYRIIRASAGSN